MNKTIFDIGFHRGEDTGYYLHLGYNVVAVDADPAMVAIARATFKNEIETGRLLLLNYAICNSDDDTVELNISNQSFWTSLHREVADRQKNIKESKMVPTQRLDTLFRTYGTPYYCKIDIEGYDAFAVSTLKTVRTLSTYISVETECIGEHEIITEEQALETLLELHDVGYRHFKLIDQASLVVLSQKLFYGTNAQRAGVDHLANLKKKHRYDFPLSATGPFGPHLEGEWVDYPAARELLLFHRRTFFEQEGVSNFDFWCDWHATV